MLKADKVAQVDEQQGQHPDDQAHHHLDRQHRPRLRLTEATWAELLCHLSVQLEKRNNDMFTVTVCWFYTGVDVNLSLLPGAIYVKPGSFRALAGTPAVHMVSAGRAPQQCREEGV